MMKTEWSWIPSSEFNHSTSENIGGVDVEVMIPYFEVPQAARFGYDSDTRELIIDFKYMTDVEPTELDKQNDISLRLGRKTKRIYQIRIDASAIKFYDNSHKITIKIVEDADELFRKNISKFPNVNMRNSWIVDKILSWGIEHKALNLASAG